MVFDDLFVDEFIDVVMILGGLDLDIGAGKEAIPNIEIRPAGNEDFEGPLRFGQQELYRIDEAPARIGFALV